MKTKLPHVATDLIIGLIFLRLQAHHTFHCPAESAECVCEVFVQWFIIIKLA